MTDYQLTQTGAEVQAILDAVEDIQTDVGDLTELTTTDKTSLVDAINEVLTDVGTLQTDVDAKLSPISYTTVNSLMSIFDTNPTSSSSATYTFTDDGWLYVYATRGSSSGYTLQIIFDDVARFFFPAFDAYAVVNIIIPVKSGQVLKFATDNSSATWTMREITFLQ